MVLLAYSSDTKIENAIKKGSFVYIKERVDFYKQFGPVYLLTYDRKNFSNLFSGAVHIPVGMFGGFGLYHITSLFSSILKMLKYRKRFKLIRAIGSNCLHAAIAKKILDKPLILSYHYEWARQVRDVNKGRFFGFFAKVIEGFTLRNADVVIALTNRLKKNAVKMGAKNIILIPNYVDTEKFSPKAGTPKVYDIYKKDKKILFVGRLHSIKRLDNAIKAFALVKKKVKNAVFFIIGDGPEREKLERLVKKLNLNKSVVFLGSLKHKHVPKYMTHSDVFIITSLMEGQPKVIVESMASGLPIIGTNVPGIKDNITDETGILAEPDNINDIAEKIILLLKNNKLREKLSENCVRIAKEFYSKDIVLQKEKNIIMKYV